MRGIIMIPTYNETQNIGPLLDALLNLSFHSDDSIEVVIVDDNSPDGTAHVVKEFQKKYPEKIHLIVRTQEKGRGTAGISGFEYCLSKDVDCIFEMDADFSHDPKYVPTMLSLAKHYDLVIGSRFVQDGEDVHRDFRRMIISLIANTIYRLALGLRVRDLASGYKCYRKSLMQKLDFKNFISHGYPIGMETVFHCHENGARMIEMPILFEDRRFGKSKFSFAQIQEALSVSYKLLIKRIL